MDRRKDGHAETKRHGQRERQTGGETEIDKNMDGQLKVETYVWMDRWTDRHIDDFTDGQINEQTKIRTI